VNSYNNFKQFKLSINTRKTTPQFIYCLGNIIKFSHLSAYNKKIAKKIDRDQWLNVTSESRDRI
jgi:hypothetical protein